MIVYPAIDLRRGRCVRLRQGRREEETVYGEDPAAVARRWAAAGATWLHVVNLDGAFGDIADVEGGELPPNLRALQGIAAAVALPIQFGGGLRRWEDITRAMALGAYRVILGTAALENPALLTRALAEYGPERVAVGLDARDGWVVTHGWEKTSALQVDVVGRRVRALGVERVVYTDVSRDGMLSGVNVAATVALAAATGLRVIASGGVAKLAEIRELRAHVADGIEGVIVGRALYTGDIALADALRVAEEA